MAANYDHIDDVSVEYMFDYLREEVDESNLGKVLIRNPFARLQAMDTQERVDPQPVPEFAQTVNCTSEQRATNAQKKYKTTDPVMLDALRDTTLISDVRQSKVIGWTESDGTVRLFRHLYVEHKDNYVVDFYTDSLFPVIGLSHSHKEVEFGIREEDDQRMDDWNDMLTLRSEWEERMKTIVESLDDTHQDIEGLLLDLNRHQLDTKEMQEIWIKTIEMCKYDISPIPVDEMHLLLNYRQRVGLALIADNDIQKINQRMTICGPKQMPFCKVFEDIDSDDNELGPVVGQYSLSAKLYCFISSSFVCHPFLSGYVNRIIDRNNTEFGRIGMFGGKQFTPQNNSRLFYDIYFEKSIGYLRFEDQYQQQNQIIDRFVPRIAYFVSKESLLFVSERVSSEVKINSLLKESTFVLLDGQHVMVQYYNTANHQLVSISTYSKSKFPYNPFITIIGEGVNALKVKGNEVIHGKEYYSSKLYQSAPEDDIKILDWIQFQNDFISDPQMRVNYPFKQIMNIKDINDYVIITYEYSIGKSCQLLFSLFTSGHLQTCLPGQRNRTVRQLGLHSFNDTWNVFLRLDWNFFCYCKAVIVRYLPFRTDDDQVILRKMDFFGKPNQDLFNDHIIRDVHFEAYQDILTDVCQSLNTMATNDDIFAFKHLLWDVGTASIDNFGNAGYYTHKRFQLLAKSGMTFVKGF